MHVDDEKIFLENIEEFVMDEGKLVTYKWLSVTLDIHVNTAKQLLYKYVKPNNIRKEGVYMTYLLGGILRDGCGMKIQIVRENDVDNAKSKFKLLTSEHVYSVQRLDPLSDLNIFYGIDNLKSDKSYEEKLGAVMYKNATRRLSDGRPRPTTTSFESNVQSTSVDNKPSRPKVEKEPHHANSASDQDRPRPTSQVGVDTVLGDKSRQSLDSDKPTSAKDSEAVQSVATKSTSNGAALPIKAGKSMNKSNAAVGNNKPTTKIAKSGIAMLFSKQTAKQSKPINKVQCDNSGNDVQDMKEESRPTGTIGDKEAQPAEISTTIDKKQFSSIKEKSKVNMKIKAHNEDKTKPALSKKEKSAKNHSRTNSQLSSSSRSGKKKSEHTQPIKKRKRIMVMSDDSASSDDDIFGKDSDTELRPLSPEILPEAHAKSNSSDEDMIPSTPVVQKDAHSGRIRKRKLVDQTYEDKDGFIITKKEYVFESCSEDEGDKQVSKVLVPVNESSKSNTHSLSNNIQENGKNDDVNNKISKKQAKSEQPLKKKKSSPVGEKTKQSNIMSFFSKS